jgi:hypothetical protein
MNNLTKQSLIKIIVQSRQPITLTIKLEFLRARNAKPDLLYLNLRESPQTVLTLYTRRIDSLKIVTRLSWLTLRKKDQVSSNKTQLILLRERVRPSRRPLKIPLRLLARRLGLDPSLSVREWRK